jgi:DNA-binding PadR family transcriptional regulator
MKIKSEGNTESERFKNVVKKLLSVSHRLLAVTVADELIFTVEEFNHLKAVLLNQGTIYASLVRLQQRGSIAAEWGVSDNHCKAKLHSITKVGKRQMKQDKSEWARLSAVIGRVLAAAEGEKG